MTRICETNATTLTKNLLKSQTKNFKWKIHNRRNAVRTCKFIRRRNQWGNSSFYLKCMDLHLSKRMLKSNQLSFVCFWGRNDWNTWASKRYLQSRDILSFVLQSSSIKCLGIQKQSCGARTWYLWNCSLIGTWQKISAFDERL